ncbi:MAG TPA: hypothetical protein VF487_16245 [Chitinophagaceae bacterium]
MKKTSTKPLDKRVSIFMTIDQHTISSHFNKHDPAPIYNRQLSQEFSEYLMNAVIEAKRYSTIRYKVSCLPEDRRFVDPVMQAVRRHFSIKKKLKEAEFKKFKKKAFILLAASMVIVMICQGLLPLIFRTEDRVHSTLSNALDVFSWVILWKPIERLIFYWNPFLKEILLLEKMTEAEMIIIEKRRLIEKRDPSLANNNGNGRL